MAEHGDNHGDDAFQGLEGAVGGVGANDQFQLGLQDTLDTVLGSVAAIQGDIDQLTAKMSSLVDTSVAISDRLDRFEGSFANLSKRVSLLGTNQSTAAAAREDLAFDITQLQQSMKKLRQQHSYVAGRAGKL